MLKATYYQTLLILDFKRFKGSFTLASVLFECMMKVIVTKGLKKWTTIIFLKDLLCRFNDSIIARVDEAGDGVPWLF